MKHLARTVAAFVLTTLCGTELLQAAATAQLNYQDYTFVTYAGPPATGVGWFDGSGSAARFDYPFGAAVDAVGNVYLADMYSHTIRKVTPDGNVSTLAGSPNLAGSADGVRGAARFNYPCGVAVDAGGNVYVADTYNHAIRKITPSGTVITLAGRLGIAGANNGTGGAARFNYPYGVAVDGGGNVFVADTHNYTIRKITPAGAVTTLAGTAGKQGTNDAAGSAATFYSPYALAVDAADNVYVADTMEDTVRKITPSGVVTTLAGAPGISGTTDGAAGDARFYSPLGVAVGPNGNLYVSDEGNNTIRQIASDGTVSTLAGTPGVTGSADGTGAAAQFDSPVGVATDGAGNVYVADWGNCVLRKIASGAQVVTLAGAAPGAGSADGAAATARFNGVCGGALDGAGNLYVADLGNDTIRKITPAGIVSTIAGTTGTEGTNNGVGIQAQFSNPGGLAVDSATNLYVADINNNTIRKVALDGTVTTLAGTPGKSGTNDGAADTALFSSPMGVAVSGAGVVYVADTYNQTIRKITPDGTVSTLAGLPGTPGNANGTGSAARFYFPKGLAVDPSSGNIIVADSSNDTIRKVTPEGVVTTLAGRPDASGTNDGTGAAARFDRPFSLAVDAQANIFVVDSQNNTIRKVTTAGVVTTLGGIPGYIANIDGTGAGAAFNYPEGVAVDGQGNLYVMDSSNNTIRKGYPALPDHPVVNVATGPVGIARQLSISNQTVTSWSWSVVLTPSASSAQLSSATSPDPMFTPDVPATFVVRFVGTNSQGQAAIGTVALAADASTLAVNVTGNGTVSPNENGKDLQLNQSYTLTATPASGYVFSNWVDSAGNVLATTPKLSLLLTTNTALIANFVPNPFVPLQGAYAGLFYDPQEIEPTNSGAFSASLTSQGSLSASLLLAGASYRLSGSVSAGGAYSTSVARAGTTPLSVQLQLDMAAKQSMTGWVSDGVWQSGLTAFRGAYSATAPAPQAGKKYTLVIAGSTNSTAAPEGYGFGTVSVSSQGKVGFSGTLGDGTKVTQTSLVSNQGQWPLYLSLYSGKGLLLGWLNFTNASDRDLAGQVVWVKQPQAAAGPYPGGFALSNGLDVTGSLYAYSSGKPALSWTAGMLVLDGADLAQSVENGASWSAGNKITGTNKLSLSLTTTSGLFQGSVVNPATGKTISVGGVLLQKSDAGYGSFLEGNLSGRVYLGPPQ